MVEATSISLVRTFACYDPDTRKLHVILLDKDVRAQEVEVELRHYPSRHRLELWARRGPVPTTRPPVGVAPVQDFAMMAHEGGGERLHDWLARQKPARFRRYGVSRTV